MAETMVEDVLEIPTKSKSWIGENPLSVGNWARSGNRYAVDRTAKAEKNTTTIVENTLSRRVDSQPSGNTIRPTISASVRGNELNLSAKEKKKASPARTTNRRDR